MFISRTSGLAILSLAFLSGCAAYKAEPLSSQAVLAAHSRRSLNGPEARAALHKGKGSVPAAWGMDALTTVSWSLHPDVALARAQLATAQAAIGTAGAHPNPSLSLSPQIVTPIRAMANTYGIDFDVPIETAGKRATRLEQARAQAAAAGFRVADMAWQVRTRLRKNFLALYAASSRQVLLVQEIATQEEVLGAFEARVAQGEASRPESLQARLLLNQLRLQRADAVRLSAEARAGVAEAAGVSVESLGMVAFSFAAFEKLPALGNARALRREALTRRSDILAALSDYAAAEAALKLEVARQYPDVHLAPGYQWDAGENKWALGLTVELPVFNQNQGPIAEAAARRRESAARFSALQFQVMSELDRALAGYRAVRSKVALAETLLAEEEGRQQTARSLLASGESDRLALASATLERDAAALGRLDARIECLEALGAVEAAAHTSFAR